jgi:hypothetical protein
MLTEAEQSLRSATKSLEQAWSKIGSVKSPEDWHITQVFLKPFLDAVKEARIRLIREKSEKVELQRSVFLRMAGSMATDPKPRTEGNWATSRPAHKSTVSGKSSPTSGGLREPNKVNPEGFTGKIAKVKTEGNTVEFGVPVRVLSTKYYQGNAWAFVEPVKNGGWVKIHDLEF